MDSAISLVERVRACTICADHLPCPPHPIVQFSQSARILIAGQAPGRQAHLAGIPFDDLSGDRLRGWLGLTRAQFYDAQTVAILPMGFCYPGSGKSGDLPPRPECAPAWRGILMAELTQLELTVVIGRYAQAYHLGGAYKTLTEGVLAWQDDWPERILVPHPSPRNRRWFKQNPWFEQERLPLLKARVADILSS